MSKKSTTPVVDELFELVNNYLTCNGGPTTEKCHEVLVIINDGADKIYRQDQAIRFEGKWHNIKPTLKQNAEPAKFRIKEMEIERTIANKKRNQITV